MERWMQVDTKDLKTYLKSINSSDVEAIEMISNPSAKYDASGNADILNIRLKKIKNLAPMAILALVLLEELRLKGVVQLT